MKTIFIFSLVLGDDVVRRAANYHTKQREAIVSHLSSFQGAHVTAGGMAAHLKERGIRVGLTTVYRQLDKLVQEGVVKKYTADGVGGACYQYIGQGGGADKEHYHLKCAGCGELIHLQCAYMETLRRHVLENHLFALDSSQTLFYGTCKRCYSKS